MPTARTIAAADRGGWVVAPPLQPVSLRSEAKAPPAPLQAPVHEAAWTPATASAPMPAADATPALRSEAPATTAEAPMTTATAIPSPGAQATWNIAPPATRPVAIAVTPANPAPASTTAQPLRLSAESGGWIESGQHVPSAESGGWIASGARVPSADSGAWITTGPRVPSAESGALIEHH